MAEQYDNADALGLFLTGAASDGGEQADADLSIGNFRSSSREKQIGLHCHRSIAGIIIERAGGENGEGMGILETTGAGSIRWRAPDGTAGAAVAIADDETKLLESGAAKSKFMAVTRKQSGDLAGFSTVALLPIYNNAVGSSDVPTGEELTKLRCLAVKNMHASAGITNLKVWLGTLGTQRVSDGGQLGASGAGTITTTGSFADWPDTGFCRITEAAGTLREIVYYSARTATALTVPATGRGLLGTTAGAGAATDKLDAVPGVKIAKEAPGSGHFTVADDEHDTDAVTGLTWSTGITAAGGVDIGSLAAGEIYGLWIWLAVAEDRVASPSMENIIKWSFDVSGESITGQARGRYRIADDTLERYELYRGIDAEPDLTAAPFATFAALPQVVAAQAAAETFFVLRKRNKYNLVSLNVKSWSIKLSAGSTEQVPVPAAPQNISISPVAAAKGRVRAQYFYDELDEDSAGQWLIYFTDTGTAPDPDVDTPTVVAMSKRNGQARLNWLSPAADNGDTLKVLVRTRAVSGAETADSDNTAIYSCTASDTGPAAPAGKALLGGAAESD